MRKLLGWVIAVFLVANLTPAFATEEDAIAGMVKSVSQIFYGLRELAPQTNTTANLSVSSLSNESKVKSTTPGRFWKTDKGMVWQIEGSGMTHLSSAQRTILRQMQLDQVRVVLLFEGPVAYAMYPKAKAYIERKVPESVSQPKPSTGKRVGDAVEELVNGHPCKKVQFQFDGKGSLLSLWLADDLAGFPIKVSSESEESTVDAMFTMVSFGQLDETMVGVPQDFKRFDTLRDLVATRKDLIQLDKLK